MSSPRAASRPATFRSRTSFPLRLRGVLLWMSVWTSALSCVALDPVADVGASARSGGPSWQPWSQIEPSRWLSHVEVLSGAAPVPGSAPPTYLDTRAAGTDGNDKAARWVAGELSSYGYQTTLEPYQAGPFTLSNVVAHREAQGGPARRFLVGAHLDSTNEFYGDRPELPAPGAVDNATGVATVLEVARVLAGAHSGADLYFVLFNGEEIGLTGSIEWARAHAREGRGLDGAIVLDMAGMKDADPVLVVEGGWRWLPWMREVEGPLAKVSGLPLDPNYFSFDSDHVPLQRRGWPALLLIDRGWERYDAYHTQLDVAQRVDADRGAAISRGLTAALVEIADLAPADGVANPPASR